MAAGLGTVLAFVVTGQFMRYHTPPMSALSDADRLLYRSRHIYILAGGLVNLMLGLYVQPARAGWRRAAQRVGSALLLASAVLLVAAFAAEPQRGFRPEMKWSAAGIYAMFGGGLLHFISRLTPPAPGRPFR